jgi:hypothetical protein
MRRLFFSSFLTLLALLAISSPVLADEHGTPPPREPFKGSVLCRPEHYYKNPPGDCLLAGPAGYLARLAKLGFTYPPQPFAGKAPDPGLTYIDIHYGKVVVSNAPVYASLDDAVNRRSSAIVQRINSPYSFISYTDEAVVDGKRFYMVEYGGWMTANEISRIGSPSLFQGLEFTQTPVRPFGWILYQIETKRSPGFTQQDYTGHILYRYQVVQVYATQHVDDIDWYMVGLNEWIPEKQDYLRLIGRVLPDPHPPEGVDNGRWIEVNLYDQTIAVYDQDRLVYASLVASGIEPFWTRPGLFQIYQKYDATPMRGSFEADGSDAYYLEDVPWTMYYDKARALHGAYWHNSFGSVRSHGCVNLSVGDAHWIYEWANVGDWVYVWDPSGQTPTDPSFYGDGGA